MLIACKTCRRQYDVEGMKPGDHVRCRCGEMAEVPGTRPREARVLHCSGCGGRLRAEARKCDYCGAEITAAERNLGPACPECFARLPRGARHCSDCGVEIRPEAIKTTRASASCPRCRGSLVLRELEKGHYTECTACGGIWLDAVSFERVVEEKDATALASLFRPSREPAKPEAPVQAVKYVPCPVCGTLMHRKNFAGCSGVVIDWCKGHGFWFDTLELEKVVAFINAGGLDRARRMDIDRAKQELQRVEAQKRQAAGGRSGTWEAEAQRGTDWVGGLVDVADFLVHLLK